MRLFLTGATGVLGRRVVPLLTGGGHAVVGLSRSAANQEWLKAHGAEPRAADLFDSASIQQATTGCHGILHLATAIPTRPRATLGDWGTNDRIRREGTLNLLQAAAHHGCRLFVAQSVTYVYGERGGGWVDETTPLATDLSPVLRSAVDMERSVAEANRTNGLATVTLRLGFFYIHDSVQTAAMFSFLKRGLFPVIGAGTAYWNLIQVEDAARAVLAAVERFPDVSGRTYNVCDDEPVQMKEAVRFAADRLGGRRPRGVPRWLARLVLGGHTEQILTASHRCSNRRAREELGWRPRYPTYREGYAAEIERWKASFRPA